MDGRRWEPSSFGLLDLFLGDSSDSCKVGIRTPEAAWDFLTVRDLVNLRCVSRAYRQRLEKGFEYLYCRDGRDYRVPYPGFPGLLKHSDAAFAETNGNCVARNEHNRAGLYPHQLASLNAMQRLESADTAFGGLRGGVLGDAPGLGKTITTLALVASTAGRRPVDPPEFWDPTRIQEGWMAFRGNPLSRSEILRCLKPVRHLLPKDELEYVLPPFTDPRFPTMESFRKHVHGLLRKQQHNRQPIHLPIIAQRHQWEIVRQNLKGLQIGMDKRNRKLITSKQGQRLLWERRLIPTSATLLVVPDALFEHWFQQIQEHLYLPLFADEEGQPHYSNIERGRRSKPNIARGVVYLDGLGDLADVSGGEKVLENTSALKESVLNAAELSGYLIVIVTFSRCRKEVRSGHTSNYEGNINHSNNSNNNKRNHKNSKRQTNIDTKKRKRTRNEPEAVTSSFTTPLLQLRWLRLMVDEGHQLETDDFLALFINQVAAERRWVVSGTPMTGNEDDPEYNSVALDQLQRILFFLRHPKYGVSTSEDVLEAWKTHVKKPFLGRKSRDNLLSVLKEIMVMHRKEDLKLPEPIFRQVEKDIPIPPQVEASILENSKSIYGGSGLGIPYALDHYLHSPEFQSLVDDAQATYAVEILQNARRARQQASSSSFHSNPTISNTAKFIDHRPIKGVVYSSSNKDLLSVADLILRKLAPENVAELYENSTIGDMSSELERFRHGNRMYRICPVCKGENGMTDSRCNNDLMEVVAVETGERFLIEPQRVLSPRNVPLARLGGEPMKNYSVNRKFWRVGDVLAVDVRNSHPILPQRESSEVWEAYGSAKCRSLAHADEYLGSDWYFGPLPDPNDLVDPNIGNMGHETNIVEMEVVLKKWQKCGVFHRSSRWFNGPRFLDSPASRRKEDTFLLCLDADLAHGLDLSFVTHIFLLEPINDAALLEQVTSRAHRLGATGPVRIETINTFYKCSDAFQEQLATAMSWKKGQCRLENTNGSKLSSLIQSSSSNAHRKAALIKVVCHHCYKQFDSYAEAEEHEEKLCPRNPDNAAVVDKYHLSSVYKEIRPPLPVPSSTLSEERTE